MTQESTNITFHRQTNQVELARPVDANSVEFLNVLPPDLTTNAKRIWVEQLTETLNFTVDGVDIHTLATRLDIGFINVRWFGAVGNGIVDDTTAVSLAAAAAQGKVLLFPAGFTFKVSSVITVGDNTTILGYGSKVITAVQQTVLSLGSGIKIFGLEIEGAGNGALNLNGRAVSMIGTVGSYRDGLVLEDCYFHGFGGYGVYLSFAKNVRVNKCQIENVGFSGVMTLSGENVRVTGTGVKGVTPGTGTLAYGIAFTRGEVPNDLTANPRSKNCAAINCIVEDNTIWEAFDTHSGENILFDSNTVRNCKIGISVSATQNGPTELFAPVNVRVTNNSIYGISTGRGIIIAGARGVLGTPTEYAFGCVVSNNQLYACGEDGNNIAGAIYAQDTMGIVVDGNNLKDSYALGINMHNTNKGFSVTGNTIVDVQDSSYTVPSGIGVRSEYNDGVISANSIFKNNPALNTFVSVRGINVSTATNIDIAFGPNRNNFDTPLFIAATTQNINYGQLGRGDTKVYAGNGSPEGVITANVGSQFTRLNGGAVTTFYVKETGTGNTGWVAK